MFFFSQKIRCKIPGYPNDTYDIQSEYHRQLINLTIPMEENDDGDIVYRQCDYNVYNDSGGIPGHHYQEQCDSWVYDKSTYDSTFASQVMGVSLPQWTNIWMFLKMGRSRPLTTLTKVCFIISIYVCYFKNRKVRPVNNVGIRRGLNPNIVATDACGRRAKRVFWYFWMENILF